MKKKSVFGVRRVSAPLALAVAMIVTATPALAADDVSPAVRAAMQRDLGLSPAQVSQYLKIERLAGQQQALEKRQGSHFAGSWIEKKANGQFQFVVATTAAGAQKAPAGVAIRGVRHSLPELDAAKGQLDLRLAQGARAPKGVYGWYVDLKSNSVVVAIGKGGQQAGIDFVARSGADARTVRFVVEAEQPSLRATVKGGLGYLRDPGDGYLYACSVGFNVTKGTTPGYVSAGHCGDAGEPSYFEGSSGTGPQWTLGPQVGTFQASNFPNPGQTGNDWSWVAISSGHGQSATVYGWGKGDATVKGSTSAAVGAAVCRSGRTTGWQCGTIEAKGQTVNYSSGETILNLTRTTACSEGGDSGGSFITTPGQAQGVLSGGSGTCRGKHRTSRSYFQPLLPILSAYGLTLKTG
jgi:streptogrisin C